MLSTEENALLTQVGPGTPMGNLMRRYWLPGFMSKELPSPDSDPMRVRLLGEDLIAFRDTQGRLGLLANACSHRGASLFYGRNENDGLRCVYHGWKYDVNGHCIDMPNEPSESNFGAKVHHQAYPVKERNGIAWVYMGPNKTSNLPPLPNLKANMGDQISAEMWIAMRDCNYMQALEGDIDTSHLGFLHLGAIQPEEAPPKSFNYYTVNNRNPQYHVVDTAAGTMYAAYRPAEEDTYYYRVAQFLMPCFTMIPTGSLGQQSLFRAWVPIDDHHTMFWVVSAPNDRNQPASGFSKNSTGPNYKGTTNSPVFQENTTDWLGRWRLANGEHNDYGIDRSLQRLGKDSGISGSYTGIDGIHLQDQAITESMSPIYQRSREHLGTSDVMVIKTRRRLLNAVKALRDQNITPPGSSDPSAYEMHSGGITLPREADWLGATSELGKSLK